MTRRTRESISTPMQRPCAARRLSLHFLLLPVTVVVAGNAVGGVQCRSDGASVVSVTSGKVGGGGGATSSQPLLHCTLQWAPECESVQTEEEVGRQPSPDPKVRYHLSTSGTNQRRRRREQR